MWFGAQPDPYDEGSARDRLYGNREDVKATRTPGGRSGPRGARLTPGEAVHVVAQICDALAYAHDQDVLHHDVSPRNILLGWPDCTAKLADFGLASDPLDAPARPATDVTGTPGHVAPEILRGATPSPKSDLYALAVVAYRLLTGPARARSGDPGATAPLPTALPRMAPLAEARPGLPRRLSAAVQRAMAHDPKTRQDSVAHFRAELVGEPRGALGRRPVPVPLRKAARGELPSAA